jgi:hypothetical protein
VRVLDVGLARAEDDEPPYLRFRVASPNVDLSEEVGSEMYLATAPEEKRPGAKVRHRKGMHEKVVILDDAVAYVGSLNVLSNTDARVRSCCDSRGVQQPLVWPSSCGRLCARHQADAGPSR